MIGTKKKYIPYNKSISMYGNLWKGRGGEIKSEISNPQNNFTTIYVAL